MSEDVERQILKALSSMEDGREHVYPHSEPESLSSGDELEENTLAVAEGDSEDYDPDDDDYEGNYRLHYNAPQLPHARPATAKGPQTGVKGVIEDYKYHNKREKELRNVEKKLRGTTIGTDKLEKLSSDDEDEEALQRYRQKRMMEMMARRSSRTMFGTVREIKREDYVREIDEEDKSVAVIIHLYQQHIPTCRLLNRHLEAISHKYGFSKFLRIRADLADPDFDEIALPTILAYKAGDLVANLVRVTDEMPDRVREEDVEGILIKHGVLGPSDLCEITPTPRFGSRTQIDADDDSD